MNWSKYVYRDTNKLGPTSCIHNQIKEKNTKLREVPWQDTDYMRHHKHINSASKVKHHTSSIFFSSAKAISTSAWHRINSTAPAPTKRLCSIWRLAVCSYVLLMLVDAQVVVKGGQISTYMILFAFLVNSLHNCFTYKLTKTSNNLLKYSGGVARLSSF